MDSQIGALAVEAVTVPLRAESLVRAGEGTATQRTVQQKDTNAINATNVTNLLRFLWQIHSREVQDLSPKEQIVFLTAQTPPEHYNKAASKHSKGWDRR